METTQLSVVLFKMATFDMGRELPDTQGLEDSPIQFLLCGKHEN